MKVFDKCFGSYWRIQKILLLLKSDAAFGDFAHLPKYKGDKEIKSLRLAAHAGSALSALRAAADYMLYSPGAEKRLVLEAGDGSGATLDILEGMVLYSLMKARYLKKKLNLALEADAAALDGSRWRYLAEQGVRVGAAVPAGRGPR